MGGFLKFLFFLVLVIVALLLGGYAWFGGFSPVDVKKGHIEQTDIVYTTHKGPYTEIAGAWAAFEERMSEAGLPACSSLGIYLDSPDTPPEDLRSIIGCKLDGYAASDLEKLDGFLVATIPGSETVTASFPFKGFPSYFIAPTKVYPAIAKADLGLDAEAVMAIEVYGIEGEYDKIVFHVPYGRPASDYQAFFDAFK